MTGNEDAARDHIATLRNMIEQERAFTIDRLERLRRLTRGNQLKERERAEWRHFHERTSYMQRELDHVVSVLVTLQMVVPVAW